MAGSIRVEFPSRVEGMIPLVPRGLNGFAFDPIFVPRGYDVTLAEDTELRDRLGPFRETIMQFARYIQSNR